MNLLVAVNDVFILPPSLLCLQFTVALVARPSNFNVMKFLIQNMRSPNLDSSFSSTVQVKRICVLFLRIVT